MFPFSVSNTITSLHDKILNDQRIPANLKRDLSASDSMQRKLANISLFLDRFLAQENAPSPPSSVRNPTISPPSEGPSSAATSRGVLYATPAGQYLSSQRRNRISRPHRRTIDIQKHLSNLKPRPQVKTNPVPIAATATAAEASSDIPPDSVRPSALFLPSGPSGKTEIVPNSTLSSAADAVQGN